MVVRDPARLTHTPAVMPALFSKPLDQATADDVRELLTEEVPEGPTVDYKELLPGVDKRGPDPWAERQQVPDRARNELLEVVVALANAGGGHLVLGLEEDDSEPKRPIAVRPLPECAELAHRFRHAVRDCIEPTLVVDIQGVRTGADGAGVVVFRVSSSYAGPHRLKQTLQAYIRRADRCEKMTMREIQDLTLQRFQAARSIEERFAHFARRFDEDVRRRLLRPKGADPNVEAWGAVRVTALPVGPVAVPHTKLPTMPIYSAPNLWLGLRDLGVGIWSVTPTPRPIVRGVRFSNLGVGSYSPVQIEEYEDGAIEYRLASELGKPTNGFAIDWVVSAAWCAVRAAARAVAVAETTVDYALVVELRAVDTDLRLIPFGGRLHFGPDMSRIDENPLILPPLQVDVTGNEATILDTIIRDMYNAAGLPWQMGHLQIKPRT